MKKDWVIIALVIISVTAFVLVKNPSAEDKGPSIQSVGINTQPPQIVPLTDGQIRSVSESIVSSGVLSDIPEESPVGLVFYDFVGGQRVWRNGLLMGNDQFLSEGDPKVTVIMHSKYISEMDEKSLCEVIREANTNGDLGIETKGNKALLLLKYSSLLKYKDCLN